MVAGELASHLLEKASLQKGQFDWAVFEVVAGGELGNDFCISNVEIFSYIIHTCTSVYYVLQSQKIAAGDANNEVHKEAVKIDI